MYAFIAIARLSVVAFKSELNGASVGAAVSVFHVAIIALVLLGVANAIAAYFLALQIVIGGFYYSKAWEFRATVAPAPDKCLGVNALRAVELCWTVAI